MKLEASDQARIGVIQIQKEPLTHRQIRDIINSLKQNSLTVLSLRECTIEDSDYGRMIRAVGNCQSLLHLNLNVAVVKSEKRVELLAKCLRKNTSLKSLFLHGSDLQGESSEDFIRAIRRHPGLISLDLGDCNLGDDGMEEVIPLLVPHKNFQGLVELALSGNRRLSTAVWCRFFQYLAINAQRCRLTALYLDYTCLGDTALTCLATALAHVTSLRTLDLENTAITDEGAQFLLYLVEHHQPNKLCTINLNNNDISPELEQAIEQRLAQPSWPSSVSESDTDIMTPHPSTMTLINDPDKLAAIDYLIRELNKHTANSVTGDESTQEVVDDNIHAEQRRTEHGALSNADDENSDTDSQKTAKSADENRNKYDDVSDSDVVSSDGDVVDEVLHVSKSALDNAPAPAPVQKTYSEDWTDEGDLLKEIPIRPAYTVIQPVTYTSRVSAGYLF